VPLGPEAFPANVDPLTGSSAAGPSLLDRRPVLARISPSPSPDALRPASPTPTSWSSPSASGRLASSPSSTIERRPRSGRCLPPAWLMDRSPRSTAASWASPGVTSTPSNRHTPPKASPPPFVPGAPGSRSSAGDRPLGSSSPTPGRPILPPALADRQNAGVSAPAFLFPWIVLSRDPAPSGRGPSALRRPA
jgi:hypothetical protein